MKKLVLLLAIFLTACGPSKKEKFETATITCNIMAESTFIGGVLWIKEMNAAREKIGESAFLGTSKDILTALKNDSCVQLVLNEPGVLAEIRSSQMPLEEMEAEMSLEEIEAEIEETDALLSGLNPGSTYSDIQISFYNFTDPFTVNINGSKKALQVSIGVSTFHDKDALFSEEEGAEGLIPRNLVGIRGDIMKVLRSVSIETLQELDGQDNLLEKIKVAINETLEKQEKTNVSFIDEAYFTEFMVQ